MAKAKHTTERYTIYDLEVLTNFFSAYFKDFATGKEKAFIIHEDRNDFVELINFLRKIKKHNYWLVGYNNLGYDGQILEYLIENRRSMRKWNSKLITRKIAHLSDEIIKLPKEEKWKQLIPEWRMTIPQLDVYKQRHYDAKRISLKWLQFTMRFDNIESMPFHHTHLVKKDEVDTIMRYNRNDVLATAEFFKRVKFETDLRLQLSAEYSLNLMNASEPRMARDIFGKFLSDNMGVNYRELKERRTYRSNIKAKDVLFKYIKFRDPVLKGAREFFVNLEFNPYSFEQNNMGLDEVKKNFRYHNIECDIGLGGIHGCVQPGVYEANPKWIMHDLDVKSFYPNLGIKNNLFPEHLSATFCLTYEELYQMRTKIPKESPINYIFKIILNSTYGLSKEPNNFLHDPKYTFAITINGQLLILMLAELVRLKVPNCKFYQFNTDGITVGYNPADKPKIEAAMKEWQEMTNLELEDNYYEKMVIMDVNNYLAVSTKGKVKRKGLFGYSMNPEDKEMDYHKNPSHLIIPKALEAYFKDNVPYEEFIRKHDDIMDFCAGVKINRDFDIVEYSYNKKEQKIDKKVLNQNVLRYYISNYPTALKKKYKPGSKIGDKARSSKAKKIGQEKGVVELESGWNTTYYNFHKKTMKIDEYNINYKYYVQSVRDIIDIIQPHSNNLTLAFPDMEMAA